MNYHGIVSSIQTLIGYPIQVHICLEISLNCKISLAIILKLYFCIFEQSFEDVLIETPKKNVKTDGIQPNKRCLVSGNATDPAFWFWRPILFLAYF